MCFVGSREHAWQKFDAEFFLIADLFPPHEAICRQLSIVTKCNPKSKCHSIRLLLDFLENVARIAVLLLWMTCLWCLKSI